MVTTIQLDERIKEKLDKLKIHYRETYNELISRLITTSVSPKKVDKESLIETIEVLSDPETMRDIAEAMEDYEKENSLNYKMGYKLLLSPKSSSFLRKLDKSNRERIEKKLKDLSNNLELGKPLVGRLSGLWSLRIGDYRAVYEIKHNELLILVLKLGHRKNIYD